MENMNNVADSVGIIFGAIAGMILFLLILYAVLFVPGLIARLLFRNAEEKKLSNFTALFMTLFVFAKTDTHGFADPFFKGFGEVDFNILKWILLLQFGIIFAISRSLAKAGIDLGNNILGKLKKREPGQKETECVG